MLTLMFNVSKFTHTLLKSTVANSIYNTLCLQIIRKHTKFKYFFLWKTMLQPGILLWNACFISECLGCVQPRQNGAKCFLNRNGEHSVLMTQVLQLWQLRRLFFVFFLKNLEPDEIGINTCLVLQNTLYVFLYVMISMTWLFLLLVLGLSILLITVVVLWYCNIYHLYNQRSMKSLWKCHSTIK